AEDCRAQRHRRYASSEPRAGDEANGLQERLIGKKLARVTLITLCPEVERRSDVSKESSLDRPAENRNAILEVSEHLRVTTDARQNATQFHHVVDRGAGKKRDVGQRCRQTSVGGGRPGALRGQEHVARRQVKVERSKRANTAWWIAADRKLIAQEVSFINR